MRDGMPTGLQLIDIDSSCARSACGFARTQSLENKYCMTLVRPNPLLAIQLRAELIEREYTIRQRLVEFWM